MLTVLLHETEHIKLHIRDAQSSKSYTGKITEMIYSAQKVCSISFASCDHEESFCQYKLRFFVFEVHLNFTNS